MLQDIISYNLLDILYLKFSEWFLLCLHADSQCCERQY